MRLNRFLSFLFLLSAFSLAQKGAAQYDEKDFTRYSVKDGLSNNSVTCLQQDDQGYLWIGTEAGLNRFDGTSFKIFFQGDAPLVLPSGVISRLKRYGPQRLGIFSRGGFEVLNTKTSTVQSFIIPDSTAFTTPLNAVWDAVELPNGAFALSTAAGFYVAKENGKLLFQHDAFTQADIGRKRILYGRDIFDAGNGRYFVYVNEGGQAVYNHNDKSFGELTGAEPEWKPFSHPSFGLYSRWLTKKQLNDHEFFFIPYADTIFYYNLLTKKCAASRLPFDVVNNLDWSSRMEVLNDSVLLINGAKNGFYRLFFNRQTGAVKGDGTKYLPNYEVLCLLTDKDGRLWAGTSKGLLKQELTPPLITANFYPPAKEAADRGHFNCVYRHHDILYGGRYARHGGLTLLDAATMRVKKEVTFYPYDTPWNEVVSIEMYHPDTLWVGTWGGILWYDTRSGHYGKVVNEKVYPWATDFHAVLAPPRPDGFAWACSYLDGKVIRYHIPTRTFTLFTSQTKPALPFDKVKNIAYDSYGDVWISGHALTRWKVQQQAFDTLINVYGGANKFNDDVIACAADNKGSLWLHNADNGLLEYRIAEKRFVAYGIKDGLPFNSFLMSQVNADRLLLTGNGKLGTMDTRTKKFTVYDGGEGFSDYVPSNRRMYYDSLTGRLYLCCEEYLVHFSLVPKPQPDHSSDLLLEEFWVNNGRAVYVPDGSVQVAHNENNLRFHFTVVDFEKVIYQFAYRLNGGDWTSLGTQRSVSFNNLSPGQYDLEIKATGRPGVEKRKRFSVVVLPPFWLRIPFLALVSALFIGIVYLLFRARVRRVRQRANLDKLLSQTEMKALQAQMNPHFIFNSLNSIREMILNNENREASHYLSKFAHLIRMTLDQSAQAGVSLRSTIDYLKRYMEMESIRNGLLTYAVTVDAKLDLDETHVSPMFIQPFIENAIWHGVSASRKNIHVSVDFKKEDEALVCTIDDNGVGISHAQTVRSLNGSRHQSHGIANIKNRIRLLNEKYNLDCGISIADKKETAAGHETGTRVTLQLPLQTTEP